MLVDQQFGRYKITSKLGEGGMGEVYAALDSELGRSVAIKLLPGEFTADADRRSRFRQEARVISALNHPNIITIYEVGENEHGSFLATEFVEGRTLRDVIERESLTLTRILHLVEQAANALVAAHAARIVHRDIKPENIMVRRDSIVKVLDFGLAKPNDQSVAGNGQSENKTIPGTVMGSARYMSPEQARGHEVDERSDIWSLGVVLYEMLTGTVPFGGSTTADTLAAVIYKDPMPIVQVLPNAPIELQRILRKALQKDRDERYQSMKDFALDIKDLLFELEHSNSGERLNHTSSSPAFTENPTMIHRTVSANHPTNPTPAVTAMSHFHILPKRRSGWWLPLAAVLVLAAGFAGFYSWLSSGGATLAATAFEKTQMVRLNTDGKVLAPAISPDGRYIAYVAGEVGNRSLVVRQISTDSSVTVVPPTNLNLQNISFTPDGDRIYYTQTRSDFSVNSLYQVPTLGGTPKMLIEDVDSAVTFSPDGRQFAFMRHSTTANTDFVFIVETATLQMEQLISSRDVGYDLFSNRFSWSPDGKRLLTGAGKRNAGVVTGIDIVEISIEDKKLTRLESPRTFFAAGNFVWFDDGSGFVFTARETQNSPSQIWRATYPDIELHQVTNDFTDYFDVGISADGESLVTFKSETSSGLWRYSIDKGVAEQLIPDSRNLEGSKGLVQATDGRLVFTRAQGKDTSIWTSAADGSDPRSLISDPGYVVSPVIAGSDIVYALQKDRSSRIWRSDADGKNPVMLTEAAETPDFSPAITPDGKTVIFQRHMANEGRSILMKVPIEGGTAEPFYSNDKWSVFNPQISPDGKRLAFVSFDMDTFVRKVQIATIEGDVFGKIERELEFNLLNQFVWAPDGKSLTIVTNRGGTLNIWRMPVDGSPAVPITDFKSGVILNFVWAADDKNLLIVRGNTNNDLILIRDTDTETKAGIDRKPGTRPRRSPILYTSTYLRSTY